MKKLISNVGGLRLIKKQDGKDIKDLVLDDDIKKEFDVETESLNSFYL